MKLAGIRSGIEGAEECRPSLEDIKTFVEAAVLTGMGPAVKLWTSCKAFRGLLLQGGSIRAVSAGAAAARVRVTC